MIAFLTLLYAAVLFVLIRLKILPNSPATWLSIIGWVLLLFLVLFIPMQWGAPSGPARIMTHSIQIVPNVNGVVTSVPIAANTPLKKGNTLFEIDETIYRSQVESIRAQLDFQEKRLEQFSTLARRDAGTRFQVEETEAKVSQLRAELAAAEWNLEETVVRAPSDGFVTYLALRPGQRVTNLPLAPVITFIDTERLLVAAQINQIHLRYVEVGQPVEIAFKVRPGRIFHGKVDAVLEATAGSQALAGGTIPQATDVQAEPFFVRIDLDNDPELKSLPPGAAGTASIYTQSVAATHIIRKVMLRMEAIMNYVNPML
jgi:RND family efflux transporter MFP subunit